MFGRTEVRPDDCSAGYFLAWAVGAFIVCHVILLVLLPDFEAKFMLGDRAHDRLHKLTVFLDANGWWEGLQQLVVLGSPGDFVLFAPAYGLFGPIGVIAQSILLYALALACLYWMVREKLGEATALTAAVIYGLLPATIFHPQAFVSEAITNPLIIIACYLGLRGLERGGRNWLMLAALTVSVVTFTRHVYIFLPILLSLLVFLAAAPKPERLRQAVRVLIIGYSVPLLWGAMAAMMPGHDAHASAGGLGANLQARAERVALIAGVPAPRPDVFDDPGGAGGVTKSLTPSTFVAFVAEHPVAYFKSMASDAANILGNPGMAMVAGRYLGLFDLKERSEEDLSRWRKIRDEHGMAAVAAELWRTSPTAFILNLAGVVVWGGLLVLGLAGFYLAWKGGKGGFAFAIMLAMLFIYVIAFSSVVAGYTRWDHRSGVEFVVAVFAAYALIKFVSTTADGDER